MPTKHDEADVLGIMRSATSEAIAKTKTKHGGYREGAGRPPLVKGSKKEKKVREMLLDKQPIRTIARATGFSREAVETYRDESLPERLIQARNIKDIAESEDVVEQIKSIQTRTLAVLAEVEEDGDHALFFKGIREVRENAKLSAELAGKLQSQPQVNILISSEWISIRGRILTALNDYPEAREAVINALGSG